MHKKGKIYNLEWAELKKRHHKVKAERISWIWKNFLRIQKNKLHWDETKGGGVLIYRLFIQGWGQFVGMSHISNLCLSVCLSIYLSLSFW